MKHKPKTFKNPPPNRIIHNFSAYGTFFKIGHMLDNKVNECKGVEIIQSMFFNYSEMKLGTKRETRITKHLQEKKQMNENEKNYITTSIFKKTNK